MTLWSSFMETKPVLIKALFPTFLHFAVLPLGLEGILLEPLPPVSVPVQPQAPEPEMGIQASSVGVSTFATRRATLAARQGQDLEAARKKAQEALSHAREVFDEGLKVCLVLLSAFEPRQRNRPLSKPPPPPQGSFLQLSTTWGGGGSHTPPPSPPWTPPQKIGPNLLPGLRLIKIFSLSPSAPIR